MEWGAKGTLGVHNVLPACIEVGTRTHQLMLIHQTKWQTKCQTKCRSSSSFPPCYPRTPRSPSSSPRLIFYSPPHLPPAPILPSICCFYNIPC